MGESNHLPLLAVVFTKNSFSPLVIFDAAADLCALLWVVDTTDETLADSTRIMRKLGTLIDIAGLDFEVVSKALAGAGPDGIVTFTDDGQLLAAKLADRLGLAFHHPSIVPGLTDKVLQRAALAAAGIENPISYSVPRGSTAQAIDAVATSAPFPVVVKPRRGAASRDTYRADDADTLRAALLAQNDEDMVVEAYLADCAPLDTQEFSDFVSVESIVIDGDIHHVTVTGRFPLAPPFRGSGMFIPTHFESAVREQIEELASAAARALGVRSGVMHTEIKVTPDGPRVIEVNGRVGGGVPDILRLLGGPRLIEWRVRLALGLPIPLEEIRPIDRVGFYLWHQPPIGVHTIVAVRGLDAASQLPGVLEVRAVRGPGDPVDWHEGGVGHVFGIGGVVDDHDEVIATRHRILELTSVEYK